MGMFHYKPTAKFKKLEPDIALKKKAASKKTYWKQNVNSIVVNTTVSPELLINIRDEPPELFKSFGCRNKSRCIHDVSSTDDDDDDDVMQKYNIIRILGKGNFSQVLQVKDRNANIDYAMKIVERKLGIAVCERELDVLKRVHHPYIVHLYAAYITVTNVYFMLELANGGDLSTRLKNAGNFKESYARNVLSMILDALKYLHEHGIAHRDLKLENCLYKTEELDSIVLLSDFGLAHFQSGETKHQGA